MTYQIVVPIYKETAFTDKNIRSINDWKHLFIVDNSKNNFCKHYEKYGCEVYYPGENIGVARSWNIGIKKGAEYTFFVSQSVTFDLGFNEVVERLNEIIELKNQSMIKYGLFTDLGWHCNGISQATVKKVGYFDENFYPSYFEDVDYGYRLKMADLHNNSEGRNFPSVEIHAKPVITAGALKSGLTVTFGELGEYYKEKWGGVQGHETYNLPFETNPLSYFPERSIAELKERYGL